MAKHEASLKKKKKKEEEENESNVYTAHASSLSKCFMVCLFRGRRRECHAYIQTDFYSYDFVSNLLYI